MASKKKDLEIIYNLQWKNKPANGDDKTNMIGMYDIPATTLNWQIFKSYLLKNSGAVEEDVKVSYITDSNREFVIESQVDFQVALYAFRRKARLGQYVNLKLERISDQSSHKNDRHSNDVQTQFDNNEAVSLTSTCCNIDTAPEWFITYMSQFKKEITEELLASVSSIISNIKPQVVNQPSCYHSRKNKSECPKRVRKLPSHIGESSHETKDLLKSLKLEGKLERKLEKLEHKTKKIKEKKLALLTKSSDSDAGQSSSRSHSYHDRERESDLLQMDAAPVNTQSVIPHMLGGEVYLHQWEVMNTGKLPWTSETSLNFTWGSKALKPLDTVISVPCLKPGETGTVAVRLQIPHTPGHYECYWNFFHKRRRFGYWLGCQVIVDSFNLKGHPSVLETSFVSECIINPKQCKTNYLDCHLEPVPIKYDDLLQEATTSASLDNNLNIDKIIDIDAKPEEIVVKNASSDNNNTTLESFIRDISTQVGDMKLQDPTDTNCSSDSDNQSILSLSESNSSKSIPEEFEVIPIPDCFKLDEGTKASVEQVNNDSQDLVTDSACGGSMNEQVQSVENTKSEQVSIDSKDLEKVEQGTSGVRTPARSEDSLSNDESQKSDIVVISIPNKEEEDNAGYAYLIVDGHRLPIPKKILNSEYLKIGEAAGSSKQSPTRSNSVNSSIDMIIKTDEAVKTETIPVTVSVPEQQDKVESVEKKSESESTEFMSHCSAAGSSFSDTNSGNTASSRLFIFPQNNPGFEVVYPVLDVPENLVPEFKWSESNTQYAFTAPELPQPATTATAPPLNLSTHNRNPFAADANFHVPNYQQTPPEFRNAPQAPAATTATTTPSAPAAAGIPPPTGPTAASENVRTPETNHPIHILPESFMSGAVNVASSAINTARSVINRIAPREPGRWVNGHWVSASTETPREANLQALAEMGFWNRDLNATLLARYNDDLSKVVAELVHET